MKYKGVDPASGEDVFEYPVSELERYAAGYGCFNCLVDFGGMFHVKCPDCGYPTNQMRVIPDHGRFVELARW